MVGLILLIVVGAGTIILAPLLVVPILNALGFSSIGPVAGSFAAWVQSWIGNVAAGSLFARLQAIAMGAGISIVHIVGGIIAGIIGLIAAAFGSR